MSFDHVQQGALSGATEDEHAPLDIRTRGLGKKFNIYVNEKDRVLELFSRRKHHEVFWALEGVSFEVERGSAYGIIGSNGAGKSTLLRILAGVSKPTRGEVEVFSPVSSLLDLGLGFHEGFSGRENIYLNCTVLGLSRPQIDEILPDIISFAELESFIDYPVRTYSTGMCLRLGFAVASHLEYQIFLIDEVLTVGDQYYQRKCVRKIEEFIDKGRTIVLVSHDLHSIRSLCDRVLWLRQGRIVADGPAAEVVDSYVDAVRSRERGIVGFPVEAGDGAAGPSDAQADEKNEAHPLEIPRSDRGDRGSPEDSVPVRGEDAAKEAVLETLVDSGGEQGQNEALVDGAETVREPGEGREPESGVGDEEGAEEAGPRYKATTDDPRLRHWVLRTVDRADLLEGWAPDQKVEPLMEYHGDLPLVTGSGEVTIRDVLILGEDGTQKTQFVTREPMTVAVVANVTTPVEDPIFGVAIHRNDDVYVYGPNTSFDNCLKGTYHGLYTLFVHYPSLPLLAGTYLLSIAVFDKNHIKPYVWHNRLYRITVKADREDHGLVVIPHHWGLLSHVSGPGEALDSSAKRTDAMEEP